MVLSIIDAPLEYIIVTVSIICWVLLFTFGVYIYLYKVNGRRSGMYADISIILMAISIGFLIVLLVMYLFYPYFVGEYLKNILGG